MTQLLWAAEVDDPDFAVFVAVSAVTGARRDEVCALRWGDVDLDTGRITVARVLVHGGPDLGWVVVPKRRGSAKVGKRTVTVGPATVAVLRAHRARLEERARLFDVELAADAAVFPLERDPTGVTPWRPERATQTFIRLRRRLGLPDTIRLHDLRHYVVTQLLDAGVPLPTVQARVGHVPGSALTLGVYGHSVAARDQAAAELLEGHLRDDATPPPLTGTEDG